jgi:hypothetical protein
MITPMSTLPDAATTTHDDVPWRFALGVLASYLLVGALCGVLWEWIWTPPTQFVQQHQLFYTDYASLRRVFDGTGLYAIISVIASALVALVVCLLTRRHELLTLCLVLVGSVAAAFLMREVGYALGPPDPLIAAKHAADGTKLDGQLQVTKITPLLLWPLASLFVTALTFFAWPGRPSDEDRRAGRDAAARGADAHYAEANAVPGNGLPADRQRLLEQIESVRFTPVRFRQGFAMDAVDTLLESAAGAITRGEPLAPLLEVTLPTSSLGEAYDKAEVSAFLDGLRASAEATDSRR